MAEIRGLVFHAKGSYRQDFTVFKIDIWQKLWQTLHAIRRQVSIYCYRQFRCILSDFFIQKKKLKLIIWHLLVCILVTVFWSLCFSHCFGRLHFAFSNHLKLQELFFIYLRINQLVNFAVLQSVHLLRVKATKLCLVGKLQKLISPPLSSKQMKITLKIAPLHVVCGNTRRLAACAVQVTPLANVVWLCQDAFGSITLSGPIRLVCHPTLPSLPVFVSQTSKFSNVWWPPPPHTHTPPSRRTFCVGQRQAVKPGDIQYFQCWVTHRVCMRHANQVSDGTKYFRNGTKYFRNSFVWTFHILEIVIWGNDLLCGPMSFLRQWLTDLCDQKKVSSPLVFSYCRHLLSSVQDVGQFIFLDAFPTNAVVDDPMFECVSTSEDSSNDQWQWHLPRRADKLHVITFRNLSFLLGQQGSPCSSYCYLVLHTFCSTMLKNMKKVSNCIWSQWVALYASNFYQLR